MKTYVTKEAAVIGLHVRGFTEYFELLGSNILRVQQKIKLLPGDITLIELYRFSAMRGR